MFLEEIVAAAVDDEEAADVSVALAGAARETFVESESGAVALSPVDALDESARLDELLHELLFPRGEAISRRGHLDLFELCELRRNVLVGWAVPDALRVHGRVVERGKHSKTDDYRIEARHT